MDFFSIFFARFKEFFEIFLKLFNFVNDDYFVDENESTTESGFIIFDKDIHKNIEKF